MLVAGFPAGPWGTNCFVVAAGPGSECVVIDPGKDAAGGIEEVVREHRLAPVAVVLTHGHIDHVWSVVPVCGAHDVPAFIHPADRALLADPVRGISGDTRAALAAMTGGLLEFTEPDDVRELADGDRARPRRARLDRLARPGSHPGVGDVLVAAGRGGAADPVQRGRPVRGLHRSDRSSRAGTTRRC